MRCLARSTSSPRRSRKTRTASPDVARNRPSGRENFQGGWRIWPDGIDGYWEGNLVSPGGEFDWYEPISKMKGKGYGDLSGYLFKGTHWIEPDTTGTSPYGEVWPANGGVIILGGLEK